DLSGLPDGRESSPGASSPGDRPCARRMWLVTQQPLSVPRNPPSSVASSAASSPTPSGPPAREEIAAAHLALLTLVPTLNFSGTVTFEYNAADGALFAATPATITLNIRSAQEQAGETNLTVQALVSTGVLTSGQGDALFINLRDNNGDAGKVRAFLNQVQGFL